MPTRNASREQGNSYLGGYIPRPRSTFPEPANFGNFLLLLMPLMVLQRERHSGLRRIAWSTQIGITILLFLFAVNSRGAIYGATFAGIALITFVRTTRDLKIAVSRIIRWSVWICASTALFVQLEYVGGIPAFVDYLRRRLTEGFGANRVTQDWQMVSAVFRTHPLLGVGFGNLTFYLGQVEGITLKGVTDAGGVYQRLLAEIGVLGTAVYVSMLAVMAWQLIRIGRTSGDAREVSYARALFFWLTADAVHRLSTVGLVTDAHLWVGFGLIMSLIFLARQRERSTMFDLKPA